MHTKEGAIKKRDTSDRRIRLRSKNVLVHTLLTGRMHTTQMSFVCFFAESRSRRNVFAVKGQELTSRCTFWLLHESKYQTHDSTSNSLETCCCFHFNSHNQVRGHRTGSSHSGAEEYPGEKTQTKGGTRIYYS